MIHSWPPASGRILFWALTARESAFLKRSFDWGECVAVTGAVLFYQCGFGLLGLATSSAVATNIVDWSGCGAVDRVL